MSVRHRKASASVCVVLLRVMEGLRVTRLQDPTNEVVQDEEYGKFVT